MKKLTSMVLICFACFSCKDESNSFSKSNINLIAPNGEQIISSISQLNKLTSNVALEKFGSSNFKITNIQYFNVKEGFVAQINFVLGQIKSHYLLMKIPKINSVMGRSTVACNTWQVSCSGNTCCTPTFNLITGNASCVCESGSNSGCTLNVTCAD